MRRPANKRLEYHKRYYREKIKPNRKIKPPYVMMRCPLCNIPTYPSCFDKSFTPEIFLRFGNQFQHLSRATSGDTAYEYAMEIYMRAMQAIIQKDIVFLNECVRGGLITKEKLVQLFDIKQVQVLKTPESLRSATVLAAPLQLFAPNQLFAPKIATFNPLRQLRKSSALIKPKYLKGVKNV